MFYIIGWIIGGVIVSAVAKRRGRSSVGWFFYGFAFGFVVPLIVLLCLPKRTEGVEEPRRRSVPAPRWNDVGVNERGEPVYSAHETAEAREKV